MSATTSMETDPAIRLAISAKDDQPEGVVGALERLALSREHLREAMTPRKAADPDASGFVGALAGRAAEKIREIPIGSALLDIIQAWWIRHPLHRYGAVALDMTRQFARPAAQRNPLGLVLGAVIAGALLAVLRPWRLLLRPAFLLGFVPAIVARVLREVPLESIIDKAMNPAARRPTPTPEPFVPTPREPAMPAQSAPIHHPAVPPVRPTTAVPS